MDLFFIRLRTGLRQKSIYSHSIAERIIEHENTNTDINFKETKKTANAI